MATSASWIVPLAFVALCHLPVGQQGVPPRPEVRNSAGMRLVEIPAGSFDMGSTIGPGEAPVHRVSVRSFWMGVTEVTQAQWQAVMGNNPSHFTKAGPAAPVEMVSWEEAQAFVRKLTERNPAWRYRLPSEAEWEYACLAGTAENPYGPPEAIAWIKENSGGTTHPVALKLPNAFGLYDMFGNVPEWTQDRWHDDYKGAPVDGSAWEEGDSPYRALRGGRLGSSPVLPARGAERTLRRDSPPRLPGGGGSSMKRAGIPCPRHRRAGNWRTSERASSAPASAAGGSRFESDTTV